MTIKKRFLALVATLGLLVGVLGAAPSAGAVSCDPGFTQTSATYYYGMYSHSNVTGHTYYGYIYMRAVGCYRTSTGQTEGLTIQISQSGGPEYPAFQRTAMEITPWTNGETDWRINETYHNSWITAYFYDRIKLKPTGEWYPGGWQVSCSYGAAGGSCWLDITRIY